MPGNQIEILMKQFTELTIDGLKELSFKGKSLTAEALYDILLKKPEALKIISGKAVDKEQSDPFNLRGELNKLNKEKSNPLAGLNTVDENTDTMEISFKRMILFFVAYLEKSSLNKCGDSIKTFKELLKNKSSLNSIDTAFEKVKKATLQMDIAEPDGEDEHSASALSAFLQAKSASGDESKHIDVLRETYQDFIDMINLDHTEAFMEGLVKIGEQVQLSRSIDDFQNLRKDILSLLHDYIERTTSDREQVGAFIKDLVARLLSFEEILASAFESTEAIYSSGDDFSVKHEEELDSVANMLQNAGSLNDLKNAVTSRIETMRVTIAEKNKHDKAIKSKMNNDLEKMKEGFEVMKKEATEAKQKAELFKKEAITDALTGALNRRAYEKRVHDEFKKYQTNEKVFSLAVLDIDHFKNINDTYGHAIGDTCLKVLVEKTSQVLRDTDIIARYGGEEFVAILPETDNAGAKEMAENLRIAVENIDSIYLKDRIRMTISVGCSVIKPKDKTPLDLFQRADAALYEAKNSGRNMVVVAQ